MKDTFVRGTRRIIAGWPINARREGMPMHLAAPQPSLADGTAQARRTQTPLRFGEVLPVLKAVWLASDSAESCCGRRCSNGSNTTRRSALLPEAFKEKLLKISPARIDLAPASGARASSEKGTLSHPGPERCCVNWCLKAPAGQGRV